ncbi:hypothetical protein QMM44_01150 [Leptospira santarosai]|uniref:hypothetical protein n=1 Tax=Leptospira santarosai TaxID=28183 RepID=UPI0024AFE8C4|nr:hypothetical protein [Leptospira santarosai]MDI7202057.1 hypothetical protein [Leptospira santarosai]
MNITTRETITEVRSELINSGIIDYPEMTEQLQSQIIEYAWKNEVSIDEAYEALTKEPEIVVENKTRLTKKFVITQIKKALKDPFLFNRFFPGAVLHAWLNTQEMEFSSSEDENRLIRNLKNWGYITRNGEFYVLTREGYNSI